MSSPGIPAGTALGASGSLAMIPGGLPKTTTNYAAYTTTTSICNGATPVTVVAANVTANSQVLFTLKTVGGTVSPNCPNVLTITPGTGFTWAGTASDTSTYNVMILG